LGKISPRSCYHAEIMNMLLNRVGCRNHEYVVEGWNGAWIGLDVIFMLTTYNNYKFNFILKFVSML